jgi:signal transduction histidine kinase
MKNKKGILFSLIKNYILFALASVIISVFIIFLMIYKLNVKFDDSDLKILPSQIVKEDFTEIDIEQIEYLNGWIEILDENNKVIYVKGKKLDNKESYTYEEIIRINNPMLSQKTLSIENIEDRKDIVTFAEAFKSLEGENHICLVRYPKNSVNINLNFKEFPPSLKGTVSKAGRVYGILFILLFILNIYLFSMWTSRKIGKPLNKVTEGIQLMSQGNDDVRLNFIAEKEFIIIRDAFNLMTEKLKESEEEKLKIEQRKNMMLVDLSHDIKTPITTIQNYSRALSEGLIQGEEKQLRYYSTIYQKSVRVNELVDDLFEFVKLESLDYKLITKNLDFIEFLRRIISEYYDEIEEKGIQLEIILPEHEIFIDFDEKLIARAISNIIINGIKHNPKGTRIRIELKEYNDEMVLEIGDNGLGIPVHIKDNIFEIFVSGDSSRRSSSGTGLGLSISKNIFEKHNWNLILLEPEGQEKTVFLIIIPMKVAEIEG